ncbi:unnamed protein product [Cylicostephanus goldi]|uniref:Adenosine 3'-phospho 5'-phosphosulfate transporter 2 n=1 Tax=Cylicostephanus goldi TaxID=71465 RepID=A0A3P7NHH6_CYLGO|nr:unnamed protein product [Cylicostephanus goldi]
MISGALVADAIIGNLQEKVMKKYGGSSNEMVFYSYSIGSVYILVITILTGEFFEAFEFFLNNPWKTYGYGLIFGFLGYLGVNVVITLIKVLLKNKSRWDAELKRVAAKVVPLSKTTVFAKDDLFMV